MRRVRGNRVVLECLCQHISDLVALCECRHHTASIFALQVFLRLDLADRDPPSYRLKNSVV